MSFETVMPPYGSTDPNASFLSSSCLDFLLIELVPLAYRVTQELDSAAVAGEALANHNTESGAPGEAAASQAGASVSAAGARSVGGAATTATGTAASASRKMDEDEERDAVFYRLEKLGYRVGQGLVERYVGLRPHRSGSCGVLGGLSSTADIGLCRTGSPATGRGSMTRST